MSSSLDPIARNDLWDTMAALQRRLSALERNGAGGGGFQTGDILHSLKQHPDMLTTTLSDGGRPGWWLLNGATDPNMQTTDPKLYELLGGNVLKSAKGRVIAGPDGVTFVAGSAVGAESGLVNVSVSGGTVTGSVTGGSVTVPSNGSFQSGANGTVGSPGTFGLTGASIAGTLSGAASGSGSANTVQPTLVAGSIWVKR